MTESDNNMLNKRIIHERQTTFTSLPLLDPKVNKQLKQLVKSHLPRQDKTKQKLSDC